MDWITDHVAIGNHLDAQDTALHQEAGVKSVLSLDGTLQPKQAEEMGLLQIVTTMLIDGRGNDVRVFWGAVDSLEFLAETAKRAQARLSEVAFETRW